VKVKCFHCGRLIPPLVRGDVPLFEETEGIEEPPAPYQEADVFVCPHCGAVNRVNRAGLKEMQATAGEKTEPLSRSGMRDGIISILKSLYPRRTGYNGGLLAPMRDLNPELFMSVLTELETQGVIEYNDTQIAMRLSEEFMKQNQGAR